MVSLDEPITRRYTFKTVVIFAVAFIVAIGIALGAYFATHPATPPENLCPQAKSLKPNSNFKDSRFFLEQDEIEKSAILLSGAVQVPTMSFDDMDRNVTKEARFKVFDKLHRYLLLSFPETSLFAEVVNTYGLLYTINGTNPDLEPICLMAHQDVVPVNEDTLDQWSHGPFSGHYDGKFVYGRGVSDTKNTLIGILEAVESLLGQGWTPERTVLLAFGFDEEIGGPRGAGHIASLIKERYGEKSLALVVDEGVGLARVGGSVFAQPAVAEKGRVDFKLSLSVAGGHSSQPPDHTGIGIMAQLANLLEREPFEPSLERDNVVAAHLGCLGAHSKKLKGSHRRAFVGLSKAANRKKAVELLSESRETRYLVRTSQAIDIINGGVKINALPETVEMQINNRIAVDSSVKEVGEHLAKRAATIATKFDLSLSLDGDAKRRGSSGNLTIDTIDSLEPAPVSKYSDAIWDTVVGTSRYVFDEVLEWNKGGFFVAPSLMQANTDTAHFWSLSHNIYRFTPSWDKDLIQFHTINEKLRFRSHTSAVMWYYNLLINLTA